MATTVERFMKVFAAMAQKAGPYLLLEILLPGGTLFALLLFVHRRRDTLVVPYLRRARATVDRAIGAVRAEIVSLLEPVWLALRMARLRHRDGDGLEALAMAPALA